MKEFTSSGIGLHGVAEKTNLGKRDISRTEPLPWWKRLHKGLEASFNAPFESDWEKKTGLHWKEWARL